MTNNNDECMCSELTKRLNMEGREGNFTYLRCYCNCIKTANSLIPHAMNIVKSHPITIGMELLKEQMNAK